MPHGPHWFGQFWQNQEISWENAIFLQEISWYLISCFLFSCQEMCHSSVHTCGKHSNVMQNRFLPGIDANLWNFLFRTDALLVLNLRNIAKLWKIGWVKHVPKSKGIAIWKPTNKIKTLPKRCALFKRVIFCSDIFTR